MKVLRLGALAWIALLLTLLGVHVLLPQRSGPIALTEVFEPYLVVTGLIASAFAFGAEPRIARPLVAILLVFAVVRYGPGLISVPSPGLGTPLQVMAWNIEAGPEAGQRALAGVLRSDAGLVGLEELQPEAAAALEADGTVATRLPYRALEPDDSVLGLGLLSVYPIVEHQYLADPPVMRAVVDPGPGDPFAVFVVHPLPARFVTIAGLTVALNATKRDADIAHIRSLIEADLAAGRSVIVLGDINTTEREPAYAQVTAGLRDAHLEAGIGPGLTWRPPGLRSLPFGLLRIDYVFASPPFAVTSTFVDCGLRSDHCRLEATIYLGTQL